MSKTALKWGFLILWVIILASPFNPLNKIGWLVPLFFLAVSGLSLFLVSQFARMEMKE